jgi:hypothetical protein
MWPPLEESMVKWGPMELQGRVLEVRRWKKARTSEQRVVHVSLMLHSTRVSRRRRSREEGVGATLHSVARALTGGRGAGGRTVCFFFVGAFEVDTAAFFWGALGL